MGVVDLAPDLSDEELATCYEKIQITYEDRLKSHLTRIKTELEGSSWFCSRIFAPVDGLYIIGVSRDASHLTREGEPDAQDVEVVLRLLKSSLWDGPRGGISFSLSVVSYGGEAVMTSVHFHSADGIWIPVSETEKIDKRLEGIEKQDPYDVVRSLNKWIKGRSSR